MIAILLVCLCFGSFSSAESGVRRAREAATCGQTSVPNKVSFSADGTPLKRIVGGVDATPHSIPWQVSLRFKKNGQHFCGGSLIRVNNQEKSDIVVTAAHCIEVYLMPDGPLHNLTENDLDVFLGAQKISESANGQQKLAVGKIAKHPSWTYPTKANPGIAFNNDIAVLKLKSPVAFSKTIQPICLPTNKADDPAVGKFGIVSGWGDLVEDSQKGSDTLQQVLMPVLSSAVCATSTTLCGGYAEGGKDSCQGDSGGPYFFKKPQGFVLHGVVSNGIGCARRGQPGVYARVSNYLEWINGKVKELSEVK